MASPSTNHAGLRRVLFKEPPAYETLYLGLIPKKTVGGMQRAVSELESAAQYGHAPADFARRLD